MSRNTLQVPGVARGLLSFAIRKGSVQALCALVIIACCVALPGVSVASNENLAPDIRVLIDVSGSMKQNDPRNLRRPAMDLLVQLLPEGGRAGIWTFGRYSNMLVPHQAVDDSWRASAAKRSRLVNSVALHTNIGLALEEANYDADARLFPTARQYRRSVILLTDGVVDISRDPAANEAERARILNEILPAYKAAGVTIHTVALSTNADAQMLETLSIETDGMFAVAEDAEDLNRIFLRAFDQSVVGDRVPLQDNRFLVDSSIEEFTALVFKQPNSDKTELHSPAGLRYDAESTGASVRWFSSDSYDLITIKQPEEGAWKISAELDPENRVTVVSDLSIELSALPNNVYLGQTPLLELALLQQGEQVSSPEFLSLLSVDAQLARDNIKSWQQSLSATDGQPGYYQRTLDMLRNTGDYKLTVTVDGKTFQRQKTLTFDVREPFRVELAANEAAAEYDLTVVAHDKAVRVDTVSVGASVRQPDGSEQAIVLELGDDGAWRHQATQQVSGEYQFVFTARGTDANGVAVEQLLGEYSLYLNVPGVAVPEPVAVAEAVEVPAPEPVVEPDPAPEPEAVTEPEPVVDEAPLVEPEEESNWLLYAGIGLGQVGLLVGLYFLYRKIVAPPKNDDEADQQAEPVAEEAAVEEPVAEEAVAEEPQVEETVAEAPVEEPEVVEEPVQEEVAEPVADAGPEAEPELDEAEEAVAETAAEPAAADEFEEVDLDSMLDVDEEELAETDSPAEDAQADDAIDVELDIDSAATADAADPVDAAADADEEVTLDLDGEFDLSSDISSESADSQPGESKKAG